MLALEKIFGLPILIAIVAACFFPYFGIELATVGFVFLFVLMFFSGLPFSHKQLASVPKYMHIIAISFALLFILTPLVQLVLAQALFRDQNIIMGLFLSACMPAAIVAPYFVGMIGGDNRSAFLVMLLSHLCLPLTILLAEPFLPDTAIRFWPVFKYVFLLVTLPLLLAFGLRMLAPRFSDRLLRGTTVINMICLGLLIYPIFSSTVVKLNVSTIDAALIGKLLALVFFQDFGTFFLVWLLLGFFLDEEQRKAISVSVGMKNTAIAAAVLLHFAPQASLPAALTFVAHAFFFNFFPLFRGLRMFRRAEV